jgi:leader peptidase (prepilin peptidase)/N-methyltransferase
VPRALFLAYAALVGACVGSFLNVCVYRWPEGLSVIRPRSRCPACETPIAWHDNVPVLGWLLLRGRCRACGVRISPQYPLIELVTASLWLAAALRYGLSWQALSAALFFTLLLGISLTDVRTYTIPHEFTIGGGLVGFALSFAPGGISPAQSALGAVVGFGLFYGIGTVMTWYLRWRDRLPEGLDTALGGGDIWMMGMVGAYLGLQGVLLTIFLGALAGLVVFVPVQLLTGKRMIPFGVFLALGAAIAEPWGTRIAQWYLRTLGGG